MTVAEEVQTEDVAGTVTSPPSPREKGGRTVVPGESSSSPFPSLPLAGPKRQETRVQVSSYWFPDGTYRRFGGFTVLTTSFVP